MKEIRLIVPLRIEEVKDRLEIAFGEPVSGKPAFYRTEDRCFCHVKPHITAVDSLIRNHSGADPTFIGIHLKELTGMTQITVSPMTSGFSLAARLFVLPVLWVIAPVLSYVYGEWTTLLKALLACSLVTLGMWWFSWSSQRDEGKIVQRITGAFAEFQQEGAE